ncbi:metal ABC transporter permease [bacterium]|nr:metal ABC transporter permease [bacterium]
MSLTLSSPSSLVDLSFQVPTISAIFSVLTLHAGYNAAIVVVGTTLLGVAAGIIGVFALLRERALMADALAHSALPGLGIAFLVGTALGIDGKSLPLLLCGATLFGVLGTVVVQLLSRLRRLHEDAAIGVVLSSFFGLGIVVMSIIQNSGSGEEGGLSHFIYGQTAALQARDAFLTLGAAALTVIASTLLLKEFRLVCFDEEFARSDGWRVSRIDLMMMTLVVIVTVIGLQSVGILLIIALLVVPPAAARFWTERLPVMIGVSAAIGGVSGYVGASLSALFPRFPAGAVIVVVAGVFFFLSFAFAPARGVVALFVRRFLLRTRVTEDHLLRELYERLEQSNGDGDSLLRIGEGSRVVSLPELSTYRGSTPFARWLHRMLLQQKGYLTLTDRSTLLTERGYLAAARKVQNHRLWEEYLLTHADIPASHVDSSADLVEHTLSPEVVEKLKRKLRQRGTAVPESLHPLGSAFEREVP